MPVFNTGDLPEFERLPGWHGRYFHSLSMTFGYYDFDKGATIHEHSHEQEEVWHVLAGSLNITIDGESHVAGPGGVAIVPRNSVHSIVAMTDGKAIVVDHPSRLDFA